MTKSITFSRKLSLSETIQVQEPGEAVHNLSEETAIWLSLAIRVAAAGARIYILPDSDRDGEPICSFCWTSVLYIFLRYDRC